MNKVEGPNYTLYHGDCLNVMPLLPAESIDLVLADPPYGTTQLQWDSVIPLEPMWEQLKRLVKPKAPIVMTASQPFTSVLLMSNRKWFRYEWIWEKDVPTGYLDVNRRPMKAHENVLVFAKGKHTYHPQKAAAKFRFDRRAADANCKQYAKHSGKSSSNNCSTYPRSVVYIATLRKGMTGHQTQKPVALMAYLIRTYTNKDDLVLDFCMGSGSTGVACLLTGRHFVGIEKDANYFKIAEQRMRNRGKCDKPLRDGKQRQGFFARKEQS